jgi:hypothetical protein
VAAKQQRTSGDTMVGASAGVTMCEEEEIDQATIKLVYSCLFFLFSARRLQQE